MFISAFLNGNIISKLFYKKRFKLKYTYRGSVLYSTYIKAIKIFFLKSFYRLILLADFTWDLYLYN